MVSQPYKYTVEIQEDGVLRAVTELDNGLSTQWEVNATMLIDNEIYFVRIYE